MVQRHRFSTTFTPWRTDYRVSMAWLFGGAVISWGLVAVGWWLAAVVVAVWSLVRGIARARRGIARERGVLVERRAVSRLMDLPEAQEVVCWRNVLMRSRGICYGDVDLIVCPVWTNVSFVVEIKSYPGAVKKLGVLTRIDRVGVLWEPVRQVKRQCSYLGAEGHYPVLWMPESRLDEWFLHRGVLVVNGGPEFLLWALRRYNDMVMMHPAAIVFPGVPSRHVRECVKKLGFVYNGRERKWYGKLLASYQQGLEDAFYADRARVEWRVFRREYR